MTRRGLTGTATEASDVSWKRSPPVVILSVALCAGFWLRFEAADHAYISQWDEAFHALVAKNLTDHPLVPTLYERPLLDYDYREWASNHIWLHKPPLPLWLMAASIAVAGDGEVHLRMPAVLLGTLAIFLLFILGGLAWGEPGRWAGALGGLLLAFNPLLIRLTSGTIPTDHIDATNVFFGQLTILFFAAAGLRGHRRYFILAGASLGLAFLCKSVASMIVLPAGLLLAWGGDMRTSVRLRKLGLSLTALLVVAAPWQIYCAIRWPREYGWESQYTLRHLFAAIEGHHHPPWWYLKLVPAHFGGLGPAAYALLAAAILAAVVVVWRRRNRVLGAILLWAVAPYLVFSIMATKLHAYVAPAIPALLLLVGWLLVRSWGMVRQGGARVSRGPWWRGHARLAAALLLSGLGLVHVVSAAAERLSADYSVWPWNFLYDQDAFRRTMREIGDLGGEKVIFNVGDYKAIQAMYYADCPAYMNVPDLQTVAGLLDRGFRIFIVLDAMQTNREPIMALHEAGLLQGITLVRIDPPRRRPQKHPYYN